MTAVVLSIGTELTRGELLNGNGRWLAERLTVQGFDVTEIACVPDDVADIVATLKRLSKGAKVLVSTGGLGPTTDDLTAEAVAKAAGDELVRDEASLEAIRRRYADAGREMPRTNEKQADLPRSARALKNRVGTAPGFAVELNGCQAFFLPGVPHEMKRLFDDHVHPAIGALASRTTHQVRLSTFGLSESEVAQRLQGLEEQFEGVRLGYRASFPEIEVKVFTRSGSEGEAEAVGQKAVKVVRERLGDEVVFGEDDDTYPEFVGHVLRDRGLTVALAESCTGGMVGSLITDVAGSSDYMLMSAVTYSNAAKTELLGVSSDVLRAYGAVSGECAAAMADGARRRAGSDIAVSITGVAGPGGGTEEKPVGTVFIGVSMDGETITERFRFPGDRYRIRRWSAYHALRLIVRAATQH